MWNGTPETCVILLASVTPIYSIKNQEQKIYIRTEQDGHSAYFQLSKDLFWIEKTVGIRGKQQISKPIIPNLRNGDKFPVSERLALSIRTLYWVDEAIWRPAGSPDSWRCVSLQAAGQWAGPGCWPPLCSAPLTSYSLPLSWPIHVASDGSWARDSIPLSLECKEGRFWT